VIWVLLGGSLLLRAAGFAYPFMAYHVAARGHGPATVGVVLAVFGVGLTAGQIMSGWLVDRIGRRRTLVAAMVSAAVMLVLAAEAATLPALLAGAALIGLFCDTPRPVLGAAITELIPDPTQRAKTDAWHLCWVVNGGAAIMGGVGGVLAQSIGIPVLYWINAAASAVFALVVWCCLPRDAPRSTSSTHTGYRQALSDVRLVLLFVSNVAALTAFINLFAAVPMIMSHRGLSVGDYAVIQLVHAVTVVAVTPPISAWVSRRVAVSPRLDILAGGAVWMAISIAAGTLAQSTIGFAAAAAATAPGEVAGYVVAAGIVHRIAPPASCGRYHGISGAAITVAAIIAPVLASCSLRYGGQLLVAATTAAVGLAGAALCLPLARAMNRPAANAPT
jgi:MFS family permease